MPNPLLRAFLAVRADGTLSELFGPMTAERRAVETIEQGLTRIDPEDLVALRDLLETGAYDALRDRPLDPRATTSIENQAGMISVVEVTRTAARREIGNLAEGVTVAPTVIPDTATYVEQVAEALSFVGLAGYAEKAVAVARADVFLADARGRTELARNVEAEALAEAEDDLLQVVVRAGVRARAA